LEPAGAVAGASKLGAGSAWAVATPAPINETHSEINALMFIRASVPHTGLY
jgi:hypothetical protein